MDNEKDFTASPVARCRRAGTGVAQRRLQVEPLPARTEDDISSTGVNRPLETGALFFFFLTTFPDIRQNPHSIPYLYKEKKVSPPPTLRHDHDKPQQQQHKGYGLRSCALRLPLYHPSLVSRARIEWTVEDAKKTQHVPRNSRSTTIHSPLKAS